MGRHSRGWLSNLVAAVKRYYGFPTGVVPQRPLPRCSSDDWYADPPTVVLPAGQVVEPDYHERSLALLREKLLESEPVMPPRHTSPTESLRGRYELESPIFAELAKPLGYDPVRGFDALFADALVAA